MNQSNLTKFGFFYLCVLNCLNYINFKGIKNDTIYNKKLNKIK
jgi:hypothetical protein